MKRLFVALGLAFALALIALPEDEPAHAATCTATDPCVTLVGGDIIVTVLGTQVAKIPAPVKTVTVKVPIPGPVQTILRPVPGPVKTILVPGPTKTVYRTRTVTKTVPGPVRTVTATPSPTGQAPVPSATLSPAPHLTPSPPVVIKKILPGKVVIVTKTKAIGISIGLILFGGLIGILVSYLAGRTTAKKKARQDELDNLRELKSDLISKE
jgi:hypothetical protein